MVQNAKESKQRNYLMSSTSLQTQESGNSEKTEQFHCNPRICMPSWRKFRKAELLAR